MNAPLKMNSCVCARTPLYPQRCALTPWRRERRCVSARSAHCAHTQPVIADSRSGNSWRTEWKSKRSRQSLQPSSEVS
jgi:hypothetical protein